MISSSRLKSILSLKWKKVRQQQHRFLIEGFHLCQEALLSDFDVETLLFCHDMLSPQKVHELTRMAQKKGIETIEIPPKLVEKLSETIHSQGIFCIVNWPDIDVTSILQKNLKRILVIAEGRDPGNVGTIIRICDWFGIDALFLSRGSVELVNPKLVRSTMGSIFHLPIVADIDGEVLLTQLKTQGFNILAADVHGNYPYHQVDYRPPLALIVGNETRGIMTSWFRYFDKTINIPRYGKAESLNMAIAAGIIVSKMVAAGD